MNDFFCVEPVKKIKPVFRNGMLLSFFFCFCTFFGAAAQQPTPVPEEVSMIPRDFNWDEFIDGWGDGNATGTANSSTAPISYDWNGQALVIEPEIVDAAQDYVPSSNPGQIQYVAAQDQTGWESETTWTTTGSWNNNQWNADQWGNEDDWFYQDTAVPTVQENNVVNWGSWGQNVTNETLPTAAAVSGFSGLAQSYNLDCETRSAVDLAAYFGVNILPSEFLSKLPSSDDPNLGFVGNYWDARGQIPPASYGVYQEPVAALLRQYGLSAIGASGFSMDDLERQIAAGKPVMVWVVGNTEVGYSVNYTPSNGRTTKVVPYQHTVIVIGYDTTNVTIQDGARQYTRSLGTFEASWAALDNRAIYIQAF